MTAVFPNKGWFWLHRWLFCVICALFPAMTSPAGTITMKNGLTFEGRVGVISSLMQNPNQTGERQSGPKLRLIVLINDDLRRTFVSKYQVVDIGESEPRVLELFKLQQRVDNGGRRVGGVGSILQITPFDEFGRRIFSMQVKGLGRIDVIQGITELTPRWAKVESLMSSRRISWEMRMATSSIPRDTLTTILSKHLDPNKSDDRLRIVRFFTQAERYSEAESELAAAIREFPDLNQLQNQEQALRQLSANELLREIEFRRRAGQHQLVLNLLSRFPDNDIADETLIKVRQMIEEYDQQKKRGGRVLELYDEHSAQLDDPMVKKAVSEKRDEIATQLNIHTVSRFNDYLRLSDDDSLAVEQKLSLALGDWVLGNGAGIQNLSVATSLYQVRELVKQYLLSTRVSQRQEILDQLTSIEGGTPAYVAKIVQHMLPPQPTEMSHENEIPGYAELTVPGLEGQADIVYSIQLPFEYDPYRRYPAIVTLHSARTSPQQQIDWWSGGYDTESGQRLGQATRHGYFVIAPHWTTQQQSEYAYSAREHAAILFSLRDACKRFAIDTDRIYLTGHSMGGDAVWDIGLAHPDLWAGVIPIVATADKYVSRYWQNARHLPFYFVAGELDGNKLSLNVRDLDRYLTRLHFDATVVEYLGRGHEHFQEEIHRIFNWMSAHRRNFNPAQFDFRSLRSWDNFCWWLELDEMPPRSTIVPVRWKGRTGVRPVVTSGDMNVRNHMQVRTGAGKVTVWLSPENTDFSRKISISVNGRNHVNPDSSVPSLRVLLEDVRTRGDRQHPFWAKFELRTGRGRR